MRVLLMGWIILMSFAVALLLITNHPGFAIKFANYQFYGVIVLVVLNIFRYED